MTFEPQTFHSERRGDCFSVRQNKMQGQIDLCLLKDGRWETVAIFINRAVAERYIETMCDFLNTYEPKEQ